MASNTATIRVGSLLEVRADAGYRTAEEIDSTFDEIERQLRKLRAPNGHCTIVDWRRCPVMAPSAAEQSAKRIGRIDETAVRSAVLVRSDTPLSVLQLTRLIRATAFENRKVFFEPDAVSAWLGEVLTASESERLRQFLAERAPLGSSRFPPRLARTL